MPTVTCSEACNIAAVLTQAAKRKRGMLDFDDLEQKALDLLLTKLRERRAS